MKIFYKLLCLSICCFLCTVGQNVFAQPPNDECVNAIDISDAFMGNCGDFTFNGPFDLTGSTTGADDPPEPGEMENANTMGPFCPDETDANLFGDESEVWENSVWYTWTVPDMNGDGSPVAYSIWTSDGSFGDDCGLTNVIGGDADTQVAIYEGPDCPNASTDACDHIAANEDLFSVPPWISGWLTLEFTPGTTYYMGVDGWDGVQGEFCLTVVLCGVECGDGECAPVETYCECDDCRDECAFSTFGAIDHREDGNFRSPDFEGNIFVCAESVLGYSSDNVYMGVLANEATNCSGEDISLPLEFSVGSLVNTDEDGLDTLTAGFFSYLELTPEDIAAGSLTITSTTPDGLGNDCSSTVTLNFADYPQATDPYCDLLCFAGGVDTQILDNGIIACEGATFELNTDGFEDLTIDCASDNGSPYQYAWRVYADLYGTGDFGAVTSWIPLGTNPTINPTDFFIDEFGYLGPYYTPGYPILPNTVPLQIRGAALCLNEDGTIALNEFGDTQGCFANNEGYVNSNISVTYLPAGDAGCPAGCDDPNGVDCAGECGGAATSGTACTDADGNSGVYNDACNCVVPVEGCTDDTACNYNAEATVDDGSCQQLDCLDECGGAATAGTACTDADGNAGVYDDACGCVVAIPGCTDDTACNYDSEATEDDGSCQQLDCAGECGGAATAGTACTDENGNESSYADDCSCPASAIPGCTDAEACNYDAEATEDDGSCQQLDCAGECGGAATAGTACTDENGNESSYADDCSCPTTAIPGCTDAEACNYNAEATEDDGSCLEEDCLGECGGAATAGSACTDANGSESTYADDCTCTLVPIPGCTDDTACNYNAEATEDDGSCLEEDCLGECGGAATAGTACTDSNGNDSAYAADCSCPDAEIPTGCTDANACNFDEAAQVDDGSCLEEDCAGECGGSATVDCAGECNGAATTGTTCTDANGNESSYADDCSCPTTAIPGCTDAAACNYNAEATEDDGSCLEEDCLGECGGAATAGTACTDANGNASSYAADCSCPNADIPMGCTDDTACNYDANAQVDDGSCLEEDCAGECGGSATLDCADECDGAATAGSACTDANGNASTYAADCSCPNADVPMGCTDDTACNYDANAQVDDGSCLEEDCAGECGGLATAGSACTDASGNASTYADDCSCPNADVPMGCTDANACNYDANAQVDDGSCAEEDCAGECGGSVTAGTACTDADGNEGTYSDDCSCEVDNQTNAEAGTLSFRSGGSYGSMNYISDGEAVTCEANDFTLVGGQEIHYVYHEDGDVTSAAPLSRVLSYGNSFTNNGLGKKEIYVTAYGATAAAAGGPDFDDSNITYSNTLPITLLKPIAISIDEACDDLSSQFTFTMNITGGLPECVSTTSFSITGDYFTGTLAHGESQTVGPIEDAENYVVSASDDNGGSNSVSKAVNCSKLPIELISFEGEALDNGNMLKWLTAAEINNEFFTVESSVNGIDFKQLNTLKGQGNTSSTSSYSYLDRTANKGLTYYRLSQTDFDGTTVEVGIISIQRGETPFNITDIYPIPTSDFINMDFMSPEQSVVDIEIYDLVGNTIEMNSVTSLGHNLLKLNVADYPSGVYFISLISDENKAIKKFVVE